uniref:Cell cycle control protein 50B n=1 Tax=Lepeophtheirus salmonis TaxID=72036 RepID=D3PHF8_LEPSM|nr:Cell cycle control protein 50B [Lepeophtheirus salmonis]
MNISSMKQDINARHKIFNSAFHQQTLPTWQPTFKANIACYIFCFTSLLFFILSAISSYSLLTQFEVIYPYCENQTNSKCSIYVNIPPDWSGKTFLYYKIDGMYQNYRSFVSSISHKQLAGKSVEDVSECGEYGKINDKIVIPCGAYPGSLFNDEFEMIEKNKSKDLLVRSDIAWESDVSRKFGILDKKYANEGVKPDKWEKSELERVPGAWRKDEDLMVWLRPSMTSNFRKLYAKLGNLSPGNYIIKVKNKFNVDLFGGSKSIVLATTGSMGGYNPTFPIILGIGGFIYVILAVIMHLIATGRIKSKINSVQNECWQNRVAQIDQDSLHQRLLQTNQV